MKIKAQLNHMKYTIIGALSIIVITTLGCTKEKDANAAIPCDTTNTTYSVTVTGLLRNYGCLGCHVGPNPVGNIQLGNYSSVKQLADNGKLFGSINWSPGFSKMPQGAPKMADCDISKIKAWIDAGAPNN